MFVQVITAPVADADAVRRSIERWVQELRPHFEGFLGATGGVSTQGTFVMVSRFESEQFARRSSDDPAQSAWWNEFSKGLTGEATFHDCTEVQLSGAGGSDDAGFVQVIQARARDKSELQRMSSMFEERMMTERPDIIGGLTAWDGDVYTDVVYFTSETEARAGEAKTLPADLQAEFERWQSLSDEVRFHDLTEPILI